MNWGKETVKLFIPPIMLELRRRLRPAPPAPAGPPLHRGMFQGPISSWEKAVASSDGWETSSLTDKTLEMALKVRDGLIEFEQDTVPRKKIVYSAPILAFIALVLSRHENKLDIVDFGGSLGTNYFQNRKVLRRLEKTQLTWNIVERPGLAELGSKHFAGPELMFYPSIEAAMKGNPPGRDSFLFSGSLQYLDDPLALLDKVVGLGAKIIAFDRLLVSPSENHEAYIQHLDPKIYYQTTFPVWCFSRERFIKHLTSKGFELVEHFTPNPDVHFDFCGMLFVRDP